METFPKPIQNHHPDPNSFSGHISAHRHPTENPDHFLDLAHQDTHLHPSCPPPQTYPRRPTAQNPPSCISQFGSSYVPSEAFSCSTPATSIPSLTPPLVLTRLLPSTDLFLTLPVSSVILYPYPTPLFRQLYQPKQLILYASHLPAATQP